MEQLDFEVRRNVVFAKIVQLGLSSVVWLQHPIWRVPDAQIKSCNNSKHPLRIKEIRRGVLVVGIPRGEFAGGGGVPAVAFEQFGNFGAKFFILLAAFPFLRQRAGEEVAAPHFAA